MVKKLFKYEFASYLKTLIPFNIVMLSVALFSRLLQFFDLDIPIYDVIYDIVFGISVVTYVLSTAACFAAVYILAVIRFYKNLYSAEGYLSFTLPVTASQHVFVKLATAVSLGALTFVSAGVAFSIFSAGDLFIEVFKAGAYLFKTLFKLVGVNILFYILEIIVLVIVYICAGILFYYTCISIGQLFKKNRVLGAFGVYFIFYIAGQIINTIVMVSWTLLARQIDFNKFGEFIEDNITLVLHVLFIVATVFCAVVAVAYFFVNRFIMTKKLNLE